MLPFASDDSGRSGATGFTSFDSADKTRRPTVEHMKPTLLSLAATAVMAAVPTSDTPRPVARPGLVFDEARGKVVLFGGSADSMPTDQTWEWDGRKWAKRDTPGPSPRSSHGMVFDTRRRRVVLFGGFGAGGRLLGDTWEYEGRSWRKVSESGPSPRGGFGIAYDDRRGRTVLFGGAQDFGQPTFTDTWEWDGSRWRQLATTGPSGNHFHRMAFDARRGRTVSFGGRGGGSETWEWDGRTWTKIASSGPPPRDHHALAYDSRRHRIVLFGGGRQLPGGGYPKDPNELWLRDLWEWDGERWTLVSADGPPSSGGLPGLTYDAKHSRLVLFGGGGDSSGALEGTWVWDGKLWVRAN
jgi:Galactose oxidase, central domain